MGWVITLVVLLCLAVLPLGVDVKYGADGPLVKVVLGPVRLKVFPLPKKEKKEKKTKKAPAAQEAAPEEPPLPQPPQPPPEPKKKEEKKDPGGSVLDFLPLVQTVLDFLGDFRRKLRLDRLELKLTMAGGDPCNLAVNYGRAWAAVGNLLPQLERLFVIKKRDIEVQCDFTASQTLIFAHVQLTITLGRLLGAVFTFAFRALIEFLKIQKKRKGGAEK